MCIEEDERGGARSSRVESISSSTCPPGNRGDQGSQWDQGYMRKRELKKDEHENENEDEKSVSVIVIVVVAWWKNAQTRLQ